MVDLLQLWHYDTIVETVKIVSRYDPVKDEYEVCGYPLHINTALQDCCNITLRNLWNCKNTRNDLSAAKLRNNIKELKECISSDWNKDVSLRQNLRGKAWNKVTLIPIAANLMTLKNFLLIEGSMAKKELQKDEKNDKAFDLLSETVYCRLLLLNWRRPGELQRLTLNSFLQATRIQ